MGEGVKGKKKKMEDARTRHQQEGANREEGRSGEEPAALLRVGTGQKALRAAGGRFF